MSLILDLGNANNWNVIFTFSLSVGNGVIPPIEIVTPTPLERHTLAFYPRCSSARDNWTFAGLLTQKVRIGVTVGGLPDAMVNVRRGLSLGRVNLVRFPKLSSTFALEYSPPRWFSDVSLTVWEYMGIETDSLMQIVETMKVDLIRVEKKLDFLIQR